MYKIKQKPEDFVVKEISSVKPGKEGKYTYFWLKKRNYTTLRALETIGRKLNIPIKKFGFAGNKDKCAITSQMCSVEGVSKSRLEKIELKDIKIEYKGKGDEPINLGYLEGNGFEIVIRNIDSKPKIKKEFVNYFGEQRFSKNNAEIGKAIVKKDFKKAVELVIEGTGDIEKKVNESIKKNPGNHVGALKTIPKKILSLYIHAYQSLLWNRTAKTHSEKEKTQVPLIGFGIATPDKCTDEIMQQEEIKPRDFIIKQIPELSSEGGTRDRIVEAKNVSISELSDDELNSGKKKVLIKFRLPKGSYATEYVKNLFQ
jgi:tRNA pseudouridine13 synthase